MAHETMRIGEVAARSNVNIQTLRYYERRGLLPEPRRTASNYRIYWEEMVRRVRFVKRARQLGFSLKEIRDLLALRLDSKASCAYVRERARAKIADFEERIRTLRAMTKALRRLTTDCSERGSVSECPILEGLDTDP